MAEIVKLFVLGLPGSGKSALARYILGLVRGQLSSVIRFNDYTILLDMFRRDTANRFKSAACGGFDVLDLRVFDEALKTLEEQVKKYSSSLEQGHKALVVIEFSRNDYILAFQQFDPSFLKGAHFLYLDADLEVCKQRIKNRAIKSENQEDDYPVSEYIFEKYYHTDNWANMPDVLENIYGVHKDHVWTFNNNHSYDVARMEIEHYIREILKRELQVNILELVGSSPASR